MSYKSYQPTKPAASKLLAQKWDNDTYSTHRKAVHNAKSTVDTAPPKTHMHIHLKLKKIQQEEERLAIVERDNRLLLEKMSTIMHTKGRIDNANSVEYKSLNKGRRQQELLKIAQENQAILKRIQARKPQYNHEEWEDDFGKSETLRHNITRFPDPSLSSTSRSTSKPNPHRSPKKPAQKPVAEQSDGSGSEDDEEKKGDAHEKKEEALEKQEKQETEEKSKPKSEEPKTDAPKEEEKPKVEKKSTAKEEEKLAPKEEAASPTPHLVAQSPFDADQAAEQCHNAMKGIGTDENKLINVLTRCSSSQRTQIAASFQAKYNKSLMKEIMSEVTGELERLLATLLYTGEERDAYLLHEAIKNVGTNEAVITQILISKNAEEASALSAAYEKLYGAKLLDALHADTSALYQTWIDAVLLGRAGTQGGDAVKDATLVKSTSEDSTLFELVSNSSPAHLKALNAEYEKLGGEDLYHALKSKVSGDIKQALMDVVYHALNVPDYYAHRLHEAVKGLGSNELAITHVVVSRCESDLGSILARYEALFGKSLKDVLEGELSGDYKRGILSLVQSCSSS